MVDTPVCDHSNCRDLVVIDPLAESFGHLLDDDMFWVRSLADKVDRFKLISSATSIQRIAEKYPSIDLQSHADKSIDVNADKHSFHSRYLKRMSVSVSKNSKVLLQSFHELSTLWFLLRNPGAEIYLIATNNLTGPGVSTNRRIFIQKLLFRRVAGIFVGSDFERKLLARVHGISPERVHKLGYHTLGRQHNIVPLAQRKKEIVFLGAPSRVRGIETFIQWARASSDSEYTFGIYSDFNPSFDQIIEVPDDSVPNLTVNNRYLSDEEYHDVIASASFVALPFENEFEGRLSGILCDAIAHGTPVIATMQEPQKSMFSEYGEFGVLPHSNADNEIRRVLEESVSDKWSDYQHSMQRIRENNSIDNIADHVLSVIFDRHGT